MGQLLDIPAGTCSNGVHDRRPTNMSACFVNGKADRKRFLHFQDRSNEESNEQLAELLFSKSLLREEEATEEGSPPHASSGLRVGIKRKRRQKEVATYTDSNTGVRCRLHPRMSLWYVLRRTLVIHSGLCGTRSLETTTSHICLLSLISLKVQHVCSVTST